MLRVPRVAVFEQRVRHAPLQPLVLLGHARRLVLKLERGAMAKMLVRPSMYTSAMGCVVMVFTGTLVFEMIENELNRVLGLAHRKCRIIDRWQTESAVRRTREILHLVRIVIIAQTDERSWCRLIWCGVIGGRAACLSSIFDWQSYYPRITSWCLKEEDGLKKLAWAHHP